MTPPVPASPGTPATPWTGVGMDPRIRARRVAVMRAAGRRRLHRLLALVAVVGLGLTSLAVTYSPAVAVRQVTIRGSALDPELLRTTAKVRLGTSLVWLDLDAIRARLEALPNVRSVHVERAWPHGVVIDVEDRHAAAALPDGLGSWVQVDGQGRVLGTAATQGGLVAVQGAGAVGGPGSQLSPAAQDLVRVAATLPPSLHAAVRAVAAGQDGPLLFLAEGGTVRLHGVEDLPEKLLAVLTVLADVPAEQVRVLDVGVPDAPVLQRSPR